jgi:hypothetical protein
MRSRLKRLRYQTRLIAHPLQEVERKGVDGLSDLFTVEVVCVQLESGDSEWVGADTQPQSLPTVEILNIIVWRQKNRVGRIRRYWRVQGFKLLYRACYNQIERILC